MRIQYVFYLNIISIKRKKYYYTFNIILKLKICLNIHFLKK